MSDGTITFTAKVLRKETFLPRYIVVKPAHVEGRSEAFTATVTLNGSPGFTRTIRPWGKGSDAFFFNLTEFQCRKAGVDTGDSCEVHIEARE